jgi:hypothetical protein
MKTTHDGRTARVAMLGLPQSNERKMRHFINSGGALYVMYIENILLFNVFHKHLLEMKRMIAELNSLHQTGGISDDDYCHRIREQWINGVVKKFVTKYGERCVPGDIRSAIDDVCNAVNEHVVNEWPNIEYVDIDEINVNHVHMVVHNL